MKIFYLFVFSLHVYLLNLFFVSANTHLNTLNKNCPNATINKPKMLPLNCIQHNLTGNECANYINIYLFNYAGLAQTQSTMFSDIPTQGYSPALPPQDTVFFPIPYFNVKNQKFVNSTSTSLQVTLGLQFIKMFGVDDITSTMKATVIFTLAWYDNRLRWNSSLTPFNYEYCTSVAQEEEASVYFVSNSVETLSEYVWAPDLTLLNTATDNSDLLANMAGYKRLQLYPSGLIKWRLTGSVEGFCQLQLRWFPFDTQVCYLYFSSRTNYIINGLNFSIPTAASLSLNNSLFPSLFSKEFEDSISWTTESITVTSGESILFGSTFQNTQSIIRYTVTLTRHSKNYIVTAIVPNILITSLSVASLWITDHPTRLAVTVTALLTIVALLVCRLF